MARAVRRPLFLLIAIGCAASSCDETGGGGGGGGDDPDLLLVDLRTDYLAGVEFASVRTSVLMGDIPTDVVSLLAVDGQDFVGGSRIAEFAVGEPGTYRLRVELLREDGDVLDRKPVVLEVRGQTGVTVVMTRDCQGIRCPAIGGNPTSEACLGGRCVDPRCSPETPELCDETACDVAVDCPMPPPCASGRCDSIGACLIDTDDERCPGEHYCHPLYDCILPADGAGAYANDFVLQADGGVNFNGLSVDERGRVYVAGAFGGALDFGGGTRTSPDFDGYILALTPGAAYRWDVTFGGAQQTLSVDVDTDGVMVVAAGRYEGRADFGGGERSNGGLSDGLLAAYDADGAYRWDRVVSSSAWDWFSEVEIRGDGEVLAGAMFQAAADLGAGRLPAPQGAAGAAIRYDPQGAHVADVVLDGPMDELMEAVAWSVDGSRIAVGGRFEGDVDIGGSTETADDGFAAFVAVYDEGLDYVWHRVFEGMASQTISTLAFRSDGSLVVGGAFENVVSFGGVERTSQGGADAFVLAFGAEGDLLWEHVFGGPGEQDWVQKLVVNGAGTVFACGQFMDDADFGGGVRPAAGMTDMFVMSLDADGAYRWDRTYGGPGLDRAQDVDVDSAGRVWVSGEFADTVDFGGGPRTSAGIASAFLLTLLD